MMEPFFCQDQSMMEAFFSFKLHLAFLLQLFHEVLKNSHTAGMVVLQQKGSSVVYVKVHFAMQILCATPDIFSVS